MSFLFPGGPIPLFDKLDQRSATPGHEAGQGLSAEGVEASVERELHRLLNSRSRISLSGFTEALGAANGITIALFQIDADLPIANTVRRVRFTLAGETPLVAHSSSARAEVIA